MDTSNDVYNYQRIERAIQYLEQNFRSQPDLKQVAHHVHLSEFHFQRLFTEWAGVSPKRFLQFLTFEHSKKMLEESRSVLDAAYEAGLSSPGRLHDLFVSIEAVTPGEFKEKGAGVIISYGFHPTLFGECLLAATSRGICSLKFINPGKRGEAIKELRAAWKEATTIESQSLTRPYIEKVFNRTHSRSRQPLKLFLKGTNFQIQVWQALLRIPEGRVVSYEDIAESIGKPGASRAIGNAVGDNPIAYVIPCHRVIRRLGVIGNYRWGGARKRAILGWEMAHTANDHRHRTS